MDRTSAAADIQSTYAPPAIDFAPTPERSCVPSHEAATNAAANENLDGYEQNTPRLAPVDELLKIEHWKPAEPQFCKEIAAHYGQSKRTIQKWFVDLQEIAPWFSEDELRLSDDRYTPLAVELLGHRYFTGSKKKWAAVLTDRVADWVESWNCAQPASVLRPDVLPREEEQSPNGTLSNEGNANRPGRLFLHIGSSLSLPVVPAIVPDSNDSAYLTQAQQRLQQFETLQQEAIAQMQEQYEQAQTLNTQFKEATSLSDQLLLQEFQLQGVQLGYTALSLKQQAFKATVQAAEAGTLTSVGKPQTGGEPSPSS